MLFPHESASVSRECQVGSPRNISTNKFQDNGLGNDFVSGRLRLRLAAKGKAGPHVLRDRIPECGRTSRLCVLSAKDAALLLPVELLASPELGRGGSKLYLSNSCLTELCSVCPGWLLQCVVSAFQQEGAGSGEEVGGAFPMRQEREGGGGGSPERNVGH